MDAVPVTLGQEFAGYAAQIRLGRARVADALPHVAQIPLGGTATGTGLNTHPEFAGACASGSRRTPGLDVRAPEDPFEAQANRDALVELSGALKVVAVSLTKIANDLALMGSGPRAGIGELFLPELQKGSSIMPGKVNPVIPEVVLQVSAQVIGNDTAITVGGLQGQFELNVRIPLIARNLLQSIALLSTAAPLFAEKCVDGIEANLAGCEASAEGTLAVATALNPYIGYDKAAEIVKDAAASGRTLREVAREHGVDEATLDAGARPAQDRRGLEPRDERGRHGRRPAASASRPTTTPPRGRRPTSRSTARSRSSSRASRGASTAARGWGSRPRTLGADDVAAVRARQRELGVREAFEWVARDDAVDGRRAAAAGLGSTRVPLLALAAGAWRPPASPGGRDAAPARRRTTAALAVAAQALAVGAAPGRRRAASATSRRGGRRPRVPARADARRAHGRGGRRGRGGPLAARLPPAGRRRARGHRRRHAPRRAPARVGAP